MLGDIESLEEHVFAAIFNTKLSGRIFYQFLLLFQKSKQYVANHLEQISKEIYAQYIGPRSEIQFCRCTQSLFHL